MAGFYASAIISYGKNKDGELKLMKHLTVPTLRFKPDLTESSFSHNFNGCAAVIKQNGMALTEYPETVSVKGDLSVSSRAGDKTEIIRRFTPAVDQPALRPARNTARRKSGYRHGTDRELLQKQAARLALPVSVRGISRGQQSAPRGRKSAVREGSDRGTLRTSRSRPEQTQNKTAAERTVPVDKAERHTPVLKTV